MPEMSPEQFARYKAQKDAHRKAAKGNDHEGKKHSQKRKSGSTSLARSNSGHFKGAIEIPVVRN